MGDVIQFPRNDASMNAATEWLVTEVEMSGRCGVSIANLREFAEKEIARPRDTIHAEWAKLFLRETERYAKESGK